MLTLCVENHPRIFSLTSGFNGGRESFHWHGVVVEFTVNWQPTENGCVHVGNLPMKVAYPADTSAVLVISTTSVH